LQTSYLFIVTHKSDKKHLVIFNYGKVIELCAEQKAYDVWAAEKHTVLRTIYKTVCQ